MKWKSFNNQFFQSFVENNVIALAPIYLFSSRFNVHCLFMPYLTIIWLYIKLNFPTLCVVLFLLFSKHLDLAMARIRYIIRVRNVNGGGRRESGSKNWIAKFNLEYLQKMLVSCHNQPFFSLNTLFTQNLYGAFLRFMEVKDIIQVSRPPMSSSDWDLTLTWHSPNIHLTFTWHSP